MTEAIPKPFRPGNGTLGDIFDSQWCAKCKRDAQIRKAESEGNARAADYASCCPILTRTLALDIGDPDYPKEWVWGEDGKPCCTAFIHVDSDREPPYQRDENAAVGDLFA